MRVLQRVQPYAQLLHEQVVCNDWFSLSSPLVLHDDMGWPLPSTGVISRSVIVRLAEMDYRSSSRIDLLAEVG